MTQPAAGNPRRQREAPTKQLCAWIGAGVKDAAKARARARGERFREFLERALRRELEASPPPPTPVDS